MRFFERAAVDFPRSDYRPAWLYWAGRAHDRLKEPALAEERYMLAVGDYAAIACREPVLAYRRALGDRRLLIALNLGSEPARLPLPPEHGGYQLVLSTKLDQGPSLEDGVLALRGDEGVILRAT